ncbi:hypothetical protein BD560DRAFT_449601 [Blakeslea trispora]|nr:hypothetical protein BD560DRAFT_449601 [Blakeslea trispora]
MHNSLHDIDKFPFYFNPSKMSNFFNYENSENWSFSNYLQLNPVSNEAEFHKLKNKFVSEMQNINDPSLKRLARQHVKNAKAMNYTPKSPRSVNITIKGNVDSSIVGSSSSVLKINHSRVKRALERDEIVSTIADADIFYHVDSEEDIWSLWHKFFEECKADEGMHEFSWNNPVWIQKPNVINAFRNYEEDIAEVFSSEDSIVFASNLKKFKRKHDDDKNALFLSKIMKLLLDVPLDAQKTKWIQKTEANYSGYFVWELFKIVTKYSIESSLFFQIGEYKLDAIKHEIQRRDDNILKGCSYNADGCHTATIGNKTVELSLLEVTGPFGQFDDARSVKDHIKGSFGALSLLHEIAYLFEFGSLETFCSIRVYFIQALGKEIRLWSLEQVSKGVCIMELMEIASVPTVFNDSEICMRDIANLMWIYKTGIEGSIEQIKRLEREHKEIKVSVAKKLVSPTAVIRLTNSIEKNCILKIRCEHIPNYDELKIATSQ